MAAIGAETGPLPEALRLRWLRLLAERRRRESPASNEAALQLAAVRTMLLVLDRRADAALLSADGAGSELAWSLLEPLGTGVTADVWMGRLGEWSFGWLDAIAGEAAALTAARLQAATALLSRQAPAQPLVIAFAGGPDPRAAERERQLATLRARLPVQTAALYSPLFYAEGRLQTRAWLEAVRVAAGARLPLVYVPRLSRAELEAGMAANALPWCGPFRAGAEAPAAMVPAGAGGARIAATLAALAAFTR